MAKADIECVVAMTFGYRWLVAGCVGLFLSAVAGALAGRLALSWLGW